MGNGSTKAAAIGPLDTFVAGGSCLPACRAYSLGHELPGASPGEPPSAASGQTTHAAPPAFWPVTNRPCPPPPPAPLQVLVATSTLAWGVNTPAHLVIIKGTEFYDAPTK